MSLSYPECDILVSRLRLLLPPLLSTQRSSWEQGICAQALLECHRFFLLAGLTPASVSLPYDFLQWLYALAHESLVRQAPDGRLSVLLNGNGSSDASAVDPACIGETLLYLATFDNWNDPSGMPFPPPMLPAIQNGLERMLQYILEECPRAPVRPGEQILSHRTDNIEIWSDTVYMLPPFLVSCAAYYCRDPTDLAKIARATQLFRRGLQQVILAAELLQAPTGEWYHIYDLSTRTYKDRTFWGVGNGWVCCGIVRILDIVLNSPGLCVHLRRINEETPLFRRSGEILFRTIRGCLTHMLPSNLFLNILDDPTSFTETNFSQMLAYTLYRLIDFHLHSTHFHTFPFPPPEIGELQQWERVANALRDAAMQKTDSWGFVRDVCGSPNFKNPGTATEGQAWAVLMEVARAQLWRNRRDASTGVWHPN